MLEAKWQAKLHIFKRNKIFCGILLISVLYVSSCLFRFKCIDDFLASACQSAEAIYKVLYWDNHTKSSRSVAAHVHSHGTPKEEIKMKKLFFFSYLSTQLC